MATQTILRFRLPPRTQKHHIPIESRAGVLLFRKRSFGLGASPQPGIPHRVEVFNDCGGISKDYGVGGNFECNCVVIGHYNKFPILLRRSNNIDNGILPELNRITKLDSVRSGPEQITGIMDGNSFGFCKQTGRLTHPNAVQIGDAPGKKPQEVFKRTGWLGGCTSVFQAGLVGIRLASNDTSCGAPSPTRSA